MSVRIGYVPLSFDGGAAATAPLAWNSADKSSGMTLRQSDITAEHMSGSVEGVRASQAITGKKVFAIHLDNFQLAGTRIGVAKESHNLGTNELGSTADSVVFQTNSGTVIFGNSTIQTYSARAAADLVFIAFDDTGGAGATKLWVGWMPYGGTATWNGNPSAGTGAAKSDIAAGPWLPVVGNVNVGPGERVTMVPVPVSAIPSGFTAINPDIGGTIWVPALWQPLTGEGGPLGAAFNLRQEVPAAWIFRSGSQVRFTYQSAGSGGCTISHATIAQRASSGDAWDWQSGTNAQITFSGSASTGAIAAGNTRITSDVITYPLDETKTYLCGMMYPNTTDNMASTSNPNGFADHILFSGTDALNTADVSGYSTFANAVRGLVGIEVPFT